MQTNKRMNPIQETQVAWKLLHGFDWILPLSLMLLIYSRHLGKYFALWQPCCSASIALHMAHSHQVADNITQGNIIAT
jgi:hypothetical protein